MDFYYFARQKSTKCHHTPGKAEKNRQNTHRRIQRPYGPIDQIYSCTEEYRDQDVHVYGRMETESFSKTVWKIKEEQKKA